MRPRMRRGLSSDIRGNRTPPGALFRLDEAHSEESQRGPRDGNTA
jgi:hypothetical protein